MFAPPLRFKITNSKLFFEPPKKKIELNLQEVMIFSVAGSIFLAITINLIAISKLSFFL